MSPNQAALEAVKAKLRALTSPGQGRRQRRAAWRATRAFLPGSAIAVRAEALDVHVHDDAKDYFETFFRLWGDPARPKHRARTAQWRAAWPSAYNGQAR